MDVLGFVGPLFFDWVSGRILYWPAPTVAGWELGWSYHVALSVFKRAMGRLIVEDWRVVITIKRLVVALAWISVFLHCCYLHTVQYSTCTVI